MRINKRVIVISLCVMLFINLFIYTDAVVYAKDESIENETIINVVDYGADPSGAKDSAVAIQKAIEAAKEVDGKVIINFPKGEYQIYPDKAAERELYISNTVGVDQNYKMKKIGILLEDMKDVIVEGNDSLFNFHGKMTTFAAINCENIIFQNYKVDFQVPTVIDISVEAITENSATFYIPECYNYEINGTSLLWKSDKSPYTGEEYWTSKNSMNYTQIYDLKTGLTKRDSNQIFSGISSIEDLGNNRVKFNYTARPESIQIGLCYQMRPTVRDHAGAFIWQSKDVELKNLDIYFLHGFGIVGQLSENITINDVDFETPKGSGRTTAGYADFIQMSGCKGLVQILNSTFSNPHDDPINVHGTFLQVVERISNNKFKVRYMHNETAGFPNFYEGDEVEFMTKGNMIPVESSVAKVVEVQGPTGNSSNSSLTDIIITLDKDMPGEIVAGQYVVENITYTPSVIISDNIFKETPTRGILVTTRKPIVIENNIFDGMGMAAIYISNDAQGWYESGPVRDVTIHNNIFKRSGNGTVTQPVIYIYPTNPNVSTDKTVHENINISNNKFYMVDTSVLGAKSVNNLTFENNEIYRLDPNIEVSLKSEDTDLKVGESVTINETSSGASLNSNLYSFNGCKNVLLKNNSYDGGLKLNASLSNMNSNDVEIEEKENIVLNGSTNLLNPVGKIYYESTDENIITVSNSGKVIAVGQGNADVIAYRIVGGRKFESNVISFKVSDGSGVNYPNYISINSDIENANIGDKINYIANVAPENASKEITWSVVDSKTGQATDAATITKTGELTTNKNGVVEVIATTVNGLESRKLLVIQDNKLTLASDFTVINPNNEKWSILGEDKIQLLAQSGSLWSTGTTNNIIATEVDKDLTNVSVTLKVKGKTKSGWDESGLIFYNDNDNYVSVERKHANGSPKIHVVNEEKGNPNEDNPKSNIDAEEIYYKLEKKGNEFIGYYSEDYVNWIEIRRVTNSGLGNDFKIGIIAASGNGTNTPFEFSELKIDGENKPFTEIGVAPSVENIKLNYNEERNVVSAQYDFISSSEERDSIVRWAISKVPDGVYELVGDLHGNNISIPSQYNNMYIKAVVIPKSNSGIYGKAVESSNYIKVLNENEDTEVSELSSANSYLKSADIIGVGNFNKFDKNDKYYFTTATIEQDNVNLSFSTEDSNANIKVIVNGEEIDNKKSDFSKENISLKSGLNVIEANVQAVDGISFREYRFIIIRTGDSTNVINNIKIDGEELKEFKPDKSNYTYIAEKGTKSVLVEAIGIPSRAKVMFNSNGNWIDSNKSQIDVKEGSNKIAIIVDPETSSPKKIYVIDIKIPKADNANLESLDFGAGVNLEEGFDPNITEYKGNVSNKNITINLKAQEKNSQISLKANGKIYLGEGTLTQDIDMFIGENNIEIEVLSPDKKVKKVYLVTLAGIESVALSSMNWEDNSFSGWGTIQKDKDVGGNVGITLIGEDDKIIPFEIGIGTHATSKIYYNIENLDFDKLEMYLGIDGSQKGTEARATIKIFIDGKEKFNSGEMTSTDKMKFVSLDVKNAKEIMLYADKGEVDYNDHISFGNAKFTTKLSNRSEYKVQVESNNSNAGIVTGGGNILQGKEALVTATANEGYEFVNWTIEGEEVSRESSYKFTVSEDVTLVANFKEKEVPVVEYKVQVESNNGNAGIVTGGGNILQGKEALVTATANEGYEFVNWTIEGEEVSRESSYKFTVSEDVTLVANFKEKEVPVVEYKVQVESNNSNAGVVTGGGNILQGKETLVTATANEGYEFVNWTIEGEEVSRESSYKFTVSEDVTLVANFKEKEVPVVECKVQVESNNSNAGVVTGGGNILQGKETLVTATANEGYEFVNWTIEGEEVSRESSYKFTVTEDVTLVANFKEKEGLVIPSNPNGEETGEVEDSLPKTGDALNMMSFAFIILLLGFVCFWDLRKKVYK
ncbi:InlB B-repeat-containing protein [Clostridium nigeriense]|uniref:InlB B-repeat-containing protein n=1 Tax=Clostridium nigeriense TaxID=1805470 RepID=UPI003D336473